MIHPSIVVVILLPLGERILVVSKLTTLEAGISSGGGVGVGLHWDSVGVPARASWCWGILTRRLTSGALHLVVVVALARLLTLIAIPDILLLSLVTRRICRARLRALLIVVAGMAGTSLLLRGIILPLLVFHLAALTFQHQCPVHHLLEDGILDI